MSGMPDGIECLESHVAALTAENAGLRAEVEEHWKAMCAALTERDELRLDLARVTAERDDLKEWKVLHAEFAVGEIDRLRTKLAALRALRAAGMKAVESDHYQEDDNGVEYGSPALDALRAALAASEEE